MVIIDIKNQPVFYIIRQCKDIVMICEGGNGGWVLLVVFVGPDVGGGDVGGDVGGDGDVVIGVDSSMLEARIM